MPRPSPSSAARAPASSARSRTADGIREVTGKEPVAVARARLRRARLRRHPRAAGRPGDGRAAPHRRVRPRAPAGPGAGRHRLRQLVPGRHPRGAHARRLRCGRRRLRAAAVLPVAEQGRGRRAHAAAAARRDPRGAVRARPTGRGCCCTARASGAKVQEAAVPGGPARPRPLRRRRGPVGRHARRRAGRRSSTRCARGSRTRSTAPSSCPSRCRSRARACGSSSTTATRSCASGPSCC